MKKLTEKKFLALDFQQPYCEITDSESDASWYVGYITFRSEPDIEFTFAWQALSDESSAAIRKMYKVSVDDEDPHYTLDGVRLMTKEKKPLDEEQQSKVFQKLLKKRKWKSKVQECIRQPD